MKTPLPPCSSSASSAAGPCGRAEPEMAVMMAPEGRCAETVRTANICGRRRGGGMTSSTTLRHVRAIDGLRALAVLGVLAFHFDFGWTRGGFLGVEVFFVV